MFLTLLFNYIGSELKSLDIYCVNCSSINLAKDATNQRNSKHISIKYHFVRGLLNLAFVLDRVDTKANVADIMSKALALPLLQPLLKLLQ